jgi:hypothetical protein
MQTYCGITLVDVVVAVHQCIRRFSNPASYQNQPVDRAIGLKLLHGSEQMFRGFQIIPVEPELVDHS